MKYLRETSASPSWLSDLLADQPALLKAGGKGLVGPQGRALDDVLRNEPEERIPTLSSLDRLGPDLVEAVRAGSFPRPLVLRPALLEEVVRLLEAGSSCVLVGETGVGKNYLLWQLAYAIARAPRGFPPSLSGRSLRLVNAGAFQEGCFYAHELETKVRTIVERCLEDRVLLAVDHGAMLVRAGACEPQDPRTVANLLYPWFDRGLQLILLSHPEEVRFMQRVNRPFAGRFREVEVPPLSEEATIRLVEACTGELVREEEFGGEAISLARTFLSGALPGSAVGLVEDAVALRAERGRVSRRDLYTAVCRRTGLPVEVVDPDVPLSVEAVRGALGRRIFGQEEAIEAVADVVAALKARLHHGRGPLAVLLFIGPSGVGKTELARQLAVYLFGSADRLVRWDMGSLVGPRGLEQFLGSGEGTGQLDEVQRHPMSVVLFDEIEKSDAYLFDALLSILGEGRIANGRGQVVSFTRCVVILTSNVGSELFRARRPSLNPQLPGPAVEAMVVRKLEERFRPEFLNRIGRVVVFRPLTEEAVRMVALKEVEGVREQVRRSRPGLDVLVDEAVIARCVEEGYDPSYGARPMQRAVDRLVAVPVTRHLAGHPGCSGTLRVVRGKEGVEVVHAG